MFTLGYTHALESLKVALTTALGFKAIQLPQRPTAIVEIPTSTPHDVTVA